MKFITTFFFSLLFFGQANSQSDFDKLVYDLFFRLPNYGGIFEMRYAMISDTVFFKINEPVYDTKTNRIHAKFIHHPILHYIKDTSNFSFILYDSVRVFHIRNIHLVYKEDEAEFLHKQFQEIIDHFDPLSYMSEEQTDYDKFVGKSISFYPDYNAYSNQYPRLNIHYNFHPGRNGRQGLYTMKVDYTEEK